MPEPGAARRALSMHTHPVDTLTGNQQEKSGSSSLTRLVSGQHANHLLPIQDLLCDMLCIYRHLRRICLTCSVLSGQGLKLQNAWHLHAAHAEQLPVLCDGVDVHDVPAHGSNDVRVLVAG